MSAKMFIRDFSIIFIVTLIVSLIVTYLYSLIVHGTGVVDWETSFRLGIIFGILFPTITIMEKSKKQ